MKGRTIAVLLLIAVASLASSASAEDTPHAASNVLDSDQNTDEEAHDTSQGAEHPAPETDETVSEHGEDHFVDPAKALLPLPPVVGMIRQLFVLQDATAAGNRDAAKMQKNLLSQIGRDLQENGFGPEPRRLVAPVVGFVLSGGNPAVAEALAGERSIGTQNRNVLKGAALYMRANRGAAAEILSSIDPTTLSPLIAGRVALVQAMLESNDDDRRQTLLAFAIATMPGSLIEESALRRSAFSFAQAGSQRNFWRRVERYQRRFSRSLYAAEFMHEAMSRIVSFETSGKPADRLTLDLFLGRINVAHRKNLLLDLTRKAAMANLGNLTKFGSGRLRRLSSTSSQEEQIAVLYASLFDVASDTTGRVAGALEAIDGRLLPPLERQLHDAAVKVARQIHNPLPEPTPDELALLEPPIETRLEQRAEIALGKAEELLVETQ